MSDGEASENAKNGRSKLQGRCEHGQRLASFVRYLVYCPSARLGSKFQLVDVMTASTGELHTTSGEWLSPLSNVFLALAE